MLAKALLKVGTKHLAFALARRGGAIGRFAAKLIGEKANIKEDDPDFDKKVEALTETDEGKAVLAEINLRLQTEIMSTQVEISKAHLDYFTSVASSDNDRIMEEIRSTDLRVKRMRPNIIFGIFVMTCGIILIAFIAFFFDVYRESQIWKLCTLDNIGECTDLIKARKSYVNQYGEFLSSIWFFLGPLVSSVPAYIGVRSWEKRNGVSGDKIFSKANVTDFAKYVKTKKDKKYQGEELEFEEEFVEANGP